jgi:hypothetical protein
LERATIVIARTARNGALVRVRQITSQPNYGRRLARKSAVARGGLDEASRGCGSNVALNSARPARLL